MEHHLSGIAIAPGIFIGKALLYADEEATVPAYSITEDDTQAEIERFLAAKQKACDELTELHSKEKQNGFHEAASILEAHIMMIEDMAATQSINRLIESNLINAETAIILYMDSMIDKLSGSSNLYIKERVSDFKDIKKRMLRHLSGSAGSQADKKSPEDELYALVSLSMLPIDLLQMHKSNIAALILEKGGPTSHTAIIAKNLSIPVVFNAESITAQLNPEDIIIVDGDNGHIYINPSEDKLRSYKERLESYERKKAFYKSLSRRITETADGTAIKLEANVLQKEDIKRALDNGADGIGLVRSEFFFLHYSMSTLPDEQKQFDYYKELLEEARGLSVTIRTLDIGGDKILAGSYQAYEENPLLGWRALRFCIDEKDIFKTQLRALLRASVHGRLRILLPFVTGTEDLNKALAIIDEVKTELTEKNIAFDKAIPLGIMIEIPSAALMAEELAEAVDFFSIGTNDLSQYTLATDRTNVKVTGYNQPLHPAVLKLIKITLEAARKKGISCSVCGELAANTLALPLLIGMGFREFSVNPAVVASVKESILLLSLNKLTDMESVFTRFQTESQVIEYLKKIKEDGLNFEE
jgi:phosphotransferase system enzyme I (PtsI)